jgi:hypothetical protein
MANTKIWKYSLSMLQSTQKSLLVVVVVVVVVVGDKYLSNKRKQQFCIIGSMNTIPL